jgi:hypothetical protein
LKKDLKKCQVIANKKRVLHYGTLFEIDSIIEINFLTKRGIFWCAQFHVSGKSGAISRSTSAWGTGASYRMIEVGNVTAITMTCHSEMHRFLTVSSPLSIECRSLVFGAVSMIRATTTPHGIEENGISETESVTSNEPQ